MSDRRVALSLVERGWQAAREWSIKAEPYGITAVHIVKGRLDPGVRALVKPTAGMRLISAPHHVFWPLAWLWWARLRLTGRLRGVVVDNERSARRLRRWPGQRGRPVFIVHRS